MARFGLLVRLKARRGREAQVEERLTSALPLVRRESGTTAWFAIRFGRRRYGLFDVFPDEASRRAHLAGPVPKALAEITEELLEEPPEIHEVDVIADKLPEQPPAMPDTRGIWLSFRPREGSDSRLEEFLLSAKPLVQREPGTTAWFAVRLDTGEYGIFDVFPSQGARLAHLVGRVPRELLKHGRSLIGSMPRIGLAKIRAEKLPV